MPAAIPLGDIVSWLGGLLRLDSYPQEEPETGLVVNGRSPVSRIACAVNTSFASIEGARRAGAELLIVHHSTWSFIDLGLRDAKMQAIQAAGLSLYAAHAVL